VNLIDADCSVVTSIGLDHADFLGSTRDSVAFEKAHVYRSGRPAICSDASPPGTLSKYATSIGADLWILGRDFEVIAWPQSAATQQPPQQWTYRGPTIQRASLPIPSLRGSTSCAMRRARLRRWRPCSNNFQSANRRCARACCGP